MKSKLIKDQVKVSLLNLYGPLVGGKDLVKVLGFRTNASFRQAVRLGRLTGVSTFEIEGRRGRFAITQDVENWINQLQE